MGMPGTQIQNGVMSFEHLRVYQAAQQLRAEVDKLAKQLRPEFRDAYRHLDEAVDSIQNNIAEGSASVYPGKRKAFYDIASGSGREARSILTSLGNRSAFGNTSVWRGVVLCQVIAKMLARLIKKLG
jgi:four helix bundle protein